MLKHKNLPVSYTDIFEITNHIVKAKNDGATIVIPHVCNNLGVFGAGFAADVRDKFPVVSTNFELLGKKNKLGYVQYISVYKDSTYGHELYFANMIAQNGTINYKNPRPLNYEYLIKCMADVRDFVHNSQKEKIEIHCPKFGSGLAGGNWNFISELIHDIWHNIKVSVYAKKPHR